ncbi:MAG: peptidoglycan editing factor PgeF [Vicinamibacterales bacterium]
MLRCTPLGGVAQHLFTSAQPTLPLGTGERAGPGVAVARDSDEAWALVAFSVGARPAAVMRVRQVHGNAVRVLPRDAGDEARAEDRPDGDALVSNRPGLVLAVLVADCVPILMADARSGAAAAVHAGWRGTCAGIAAAAVARLADAFGTRPADLVVAIGPSIGPDDYEVGEGLLADFAAAGHGDAARARWFRRGQGGRWHLDLWQANQDQLVAAGVRAGNIHACGLSTFRHPMWLESYRRDGPRAGRMAAAIIVP